MKKNKSLFIILIILVIVTVFFVIKKNNSTLDKELTDFAIKDTAAITKIFIADRNGNTISLERKSNFQWIINGKDEPKPEMVKMILETMYKIQVKARVAKAAYNNVVKELASSGIKCEIYLHNEQLPSKTMYVGGPTEDTEGTFMILEKSSSPFICELSGFQGYLTPRFSTDIDAWKNILIFRTNPEEIKSVSVSYSFYPDKSFTITSINNKYTLESQSFKKSISPDSILIDNYLRLYKQVYFESRIKKMSASIRDSIISSQPMVIVNLSTKAGQIKSVELHPMAISENSLAQQDSLGNPLKYDLDRMYGYIKPENELVTIQHYTFDKLLRQWSDFSKERQ